MYNDDRLTISKALHRHQVQDNGLHEQLGFQVPAQSPRLHASEYNILH